MASVSRPWRISLAAAATPLRHWGLQALRIFRTLFVRSAETSFLIHYFGCRDRDPTLVSLAMITSQDRQMSAQRVIWLILPVVLTAMSLWLIAVRTPASR